MTYKLLLDFDGTITKEDTCVAMLNEFATEDWKRLDELWASGELTTRQCADETFKLMNFTRDQLFEYLQTLYIDEYFDDLIDICDEKSIEVIIVSDGYNFNINTIIDSKSKYKPVIYSNTMEFDEKDNCILGFPNYNQNCGKCGTCKTNIYNEYKKDCDQIIYVGDGYSDRCVAGKADIVFAKSSLKAYCIEKNISYRDYNSFKDVIEFINNNIV